MSTSIGITVTATICRNWNFVNYLTISKTQLCLSAVNSDVFFWHFFILIFLSSTLSSSLISSWSYRFSQCFNNITDWKTFITIGKWSKLRCNEQLRRSPREIRAEYSITRCSSFLLCAGCKLSNMGYTHEQINTIHCNTE